MTQSKAAKATHDKVAQRASAVSASVENESFTNRVNADTTLSENKRQMFDETRSGS